MNGDSPVASTDFVRLAEACQRLAVFGEHFSEDVQLIETAVAALPDAPAQLCEELASWTAYFRRVDNLSTADDIRQCVLGMDITGPLMRPTFEIVQLVKSATWHKIWHKSFTLTAKPAIEDPEAHELAAQTCFKDIMGPEWCAMVESLNTKYT